MNQQFIGVPMAKSPNTPLSHYLQKLEEISARIDDAESLDDEIIREFESAHDDLKGKVDRCLGFLDAANAFLAGSEERFKVLESERRRMRRAAEGLENYMIRLIQEKPDLPWTGTMERLIIKQNRPSIDCVFPLGKKSLSNIVPDECLAIDPSLLPYTEEITVRVLDKDRVREALKLGIKVESAFEFRKPSLGRKPL